MEKKKQKFTEVSHRFKFKEPSTEPWSIDFEFCWQEKRGIEPLGWGRGEWRCGQKGLEGMG